MIQIVNFSRAQVCLELRNRSVLQQQAAGLVLGKQQRQPLQEPASLELNQLLDSVYLPPPVSELLLLHHSQDSVNSVALFLKCRFKSYAFEIGTGGTGLFGSGGAQTGFGAKPAAPSLFGTSTATQPTMGGFGQPAQPPLFGATGTATAPKQSLFGSTGGFGSGGFGATTSFAAPGAPSAGTGLFGGASTALPIAAAPLGQAAPAPAESQLPIHQYILTLSEISQSSDHPLFRKMLEPSGMLRLIFW